MRQVASSISSDDEGHSSDHQCQAIKSDNVYFFRNVLVKVDDILFKFPQVYLEQSIVLRALLDRDSHDNSNRSENEPLQLEGYGSDELGQLLRILIPTIHGQTPLLTSSECISVLKLATMWNYDSIRASIIHQLLPHARKDPVLRIIVAIQYDVPDWLVPGVNALAQRDQPLSSQDADRFNVLQDRMRMVDLLLKITAVRERFHGSSSEARRSYDFIPHICDIFGLEPYKLLERELQANSKGEPNPGAFSHSAKLGQPSDHQIEDTSQFSTSHLPPPYKAQRSQHQMNHNQRDEEAATAARIEGQRLEEITRRTAAALAHDEADSRKKRRKSCIADAIARSRLLQRYENQAQEAELGHLQLEYALCQAHRAKQGPADYLEHYEALDHLGPCDGGLLNNAARNLQSAATVLAVLQNEVQPIKATADADEEVAAALERQSGLDLAKQARASTARRKAHSSARILLPALRNLMIAENQFREARRLVEVLRISLVSDSPQRTFSR